MVFCTMQNKNLIRIDVFFQNPLFFRTYICYDIKDYMCTNEPVRGYYREENQNLHTASIRDLAVY